MKLATYNVNGINGRLAVLLRWLEEASPDLVCLQELKAPQDKFPLDAIRTAGYEAVWKGQKQWNGVAVLAKGKEMQEITRVLPGDDSDIQSRYLELLVNGMVIVCVYVPNGNPTPGPKYDYKLQWMDRLRTRAKTLLAHNIPVAIIGDFNVMPEAIDVYKPEKYVNDALFKTETRAAFEQLKELGYTDALRHLYPDKVLYTFWDYFRNAYSRDAGLRIDHFLVSAQLVPHLKRGGVDRHVRGWEKSSDHAPVWIELKGLSKS